MANDRVVSKKPFGNHGQVIPGREPSLKTNGGLMYYSYDGMRNVTELTDRHGDSIEQYRYDAFGGLYTGVTAPYNTNSFAGKNYDAKANLIDMNARWYGAQNGRFTTADPYTGDILTPYTQNRYAYVGNNPINRWDPLGYWMAGDDDLSAKARSKIAEYEKEYDAATTDEGRTAAHNKADSVRAKDRNRWTTEDEHKIGSWDSEPVIDYDTPLKLSDGWKTDWTRTDRYYEKYEVTSSLHTAYAGVISTTVSIRTDTTTTVTHGFDFRAFTPSEWYQENKAILRQYDIPISQVKSYYEPKDAYSKTTSSSRSITSTEKIVSRNDFNNYKSDIVIDTLKDKQGGNNTAVLRALTPEESIRWKNSKSINYIPGLSTLNKLSIVAKGQDLYGYIKNDGEIKNAGEELVMDIAVLSIGGMLKAATAIEASLIDDAAAGVKYFDEAGDAVAGAAKTENPLANIKYTDKVKTQAAKGDYHGFPESVDGFGTNGNVTQFTGGDKIVRTKVEIPGSYDGKTGVFEYIIEPDGVTCNHRLFKPTK